jgi:hypothetical protein
MTPNNVLWPRVTVKSVAPAYRFIPLTHFVAAILCLLPWALPAVAGTSGNGSLRGGTDHYYCSSDMGQPTIYFSAAFDFSWPAGTVRVQDSVIGNEFKQSLVTKYGYTANVVCFGTASLAQTQTDEKSRATNMRASKKWKVVETGWKWSGATRGGGSASESDQSPAQTEASGSAGASGSSGNSSGSSSGSGSAQAAAGAAVQPRLQTRFFRGQPGAEFCSG